MNKTIICFLFFIFSTAASATPGSWTPAFQYIESIIVEEGTALIIIKDGIPSGYIPTECNSPYNQADLGTEHGRALYSMALSAKLSHKPIKMALHCLGSRPRITHMWLRD